MFLAICSTALEDCSTLEAWRRPPSLTASIDSVKAPTAAAVPSTLAPSLCPTPTSRTAPLQVRYRVAELAEEGVEVADEVAYLVLHVQVDAGREVGFALGELAEPAGGEAEGPRDRAGYRGSI